MTTATTITAEHYSQPEVRESILRYCQNEAMFRALNGDEHWYAQSARLGQVRLTTPDDYDYIVDKYRTLYATIDHLDEPVKKISETWNVENGAPENPIGTLADCRAFTLSVDIDSIKRSTGENIVTSPAIKKAVEDAGQFFVKCLHDAGISKSVHCLYSGGGAYAHIHHALTSAYPDWTPDNSEHVFRLLATSYNYLIADIETNFFRTYPEYQGLVKFDKLNNQKRKFKCIFSIHKKLPFAVIPLDPDHIEIDFEKARIPLPSGVLAEGSRWYQSYDLSEKDGLKTLLMPYYKQAEKDLKDHEHKSRADAHEISRYSDPVPIENWPPCMKNIIQTCAPDRGPHRALAVLAAFLYQVGWPEDEAYRLWDFVAGPVGVEPRIFNVWYGSMRCASCYTIKHRTDGYPSTGLGEHGYCPGRC